MGNYIAGSLNGKFPEFSLDKLEVIGLQTNNACNLSCKHCYLNVKRFDKYLSQMEWIKLLQSIFTDLCPSVVTFVGKEVFINKKSAKLLFEAIKLRDELQFSHSTEIGVLTNGTLLHGYYDQLMESAPDYIDVSIDGLPEVHDQIRGRGAFDMLRPNLLWLQKNFSGNTWITHTLTALNKTLLPEFITFYHSQFGICRFAIGIYTQLKHTDPSLQLYIEDYEQIINEMLRSLENLSLNSSVEVIMDFNSNQREILEIFSKNGWANALDNISSVTHEFSNGLKVRMDSSRIPVGLWRSVRITPEGYWIAAEDIMKVDEYDKVATASVRACDYNISKLYQTGLTSKRFMEFMDYSPCLAHYQETLCDAV